MTRIENLLTILSEECVETAQRVSKAIRFTLEEVQPKQDLTNAERIVYEFNDIIAVMEILQEEGVFETSESAHIGDLYRYTVKAESKEEAFKKLVQYFFGENMNQEVKSEHRTFSYPTQARFDYKNMPRWFAKRISGNVRDKSCNYQHELEKYAIENNIKLKH